MTSRDQATESTLTSIKNLCQQGLYADAHAQAVETWGAMETWEGLEQWLIALKLYHALGSERRSDALLLKLCRRFNDDPDLAFRKLFYLLDRKGPLITLEHLQSRRTSLESGETGKSDVQGFLAILYMQFKDYVQAEACLLAAKELQPDDKWIDILCVQLTQEQGQSDQAREQAQAQLAASPTINGVRNLASLQLRTLGLPAALDVYQTYIDLFQSAALWLEYTNLLIKAQRWEACEQALTKFETLYLFKDKVVDRAVAAIKAQLAIAGEQYASAIKHLAHHPDYYWRVVRDNLKKADANAQRKLLEVPQIRQEHMTCAPSSMAAICQYFGHPRNDKDIADEICFDGTPDALERAWLEDNGYPFIEFELDELALHTLIDQNLPFLLVTTQGLNSHMQVVVGYDKPVGTMLIMDPSQPSLVEMLLQQTLESEDFSGPRCLVFVPQDERSRLNGLALKSADVYPYFARFQKARHGNDLEASQAAAKRLQAAFPEHKLNKLVQRSLALWHQNWPEALKFNQALLEQYPNETMLLSSRYFCRRDLGQRSEALDELAAYLDCVHDADLIITLFNEVYETNEHAVRVDTLLAQLKQYSCRYGQAMWSLASFYWDRQDHDRAMQYYRFAFCLDETNNDFVESYFKAARYLGQTKTALTFLVNRFEKFRVRSPQPAVSLYQALALLDRESEGLEYLKLAQEHHSDDQELLRFTAKALIDTGQYEQFDALLPVLDSVLGVEALGDLRARKQEEYGDLDGALAHYRQRFESNPLLSEHAERYFSLLYRMGDRATLDSVLEQLSQDYPDTNQMLERIADWHSNVHKQEAAQARLVSARQDQEQAHKVHVSLLTKLGRFDDAVAAARRWQTHLPGSLDAQASLSECLVSTGEFELARQLAETVLSKRVDNTQAFSALMASCRDNEAKASALRFMFDQLSVQVSFGDAAWNIWFHVGSRFAETELSEWMNMLLSRHDHLWSTHSIAMKYHLQFNRFEEAQTCISRAIELFPLVPRLYSDQAELYVARGENQHAIEAYQQALTLNPRWTDVSRQLCELYEKQGAFEQARDVIEQALKRSPHDASLYGYLADLQERLGEIDNAVRSLSQALKHNSDYRWAWDRLLALRPASESDHVKSLAISLSEQYHYLPVSWLNLAHVSRDSEDKAAYLQKALALNPLYEEAYLDWVELDKQLGRFDDALARLESSPWGQHLPFSLAFLRAELLESTGKRREACDYLLSHLIQEKGHAGKWQSLYRWLAELKDKAGRIAAAKQQVALNPHDASSLCVAAEIMLDSHAEEDMNEADRLLERAWRLAPSEQYIVLTYVDRLLSQRRFEQALVVLDAFKTHRDNQFVLTREVHAYASSDQQEQALERFRSMLRSGADSYWCLDNGYRALTGSLDEDILLDELIENPESLPHMQAFFWSDKMLSRSKKARNRVMAVLDKLPACAAWFGACQAMFEYCSDNDLLPDQKFVERHHATLCQNAALVSTLGYALLGQNHLHEALRLYESTPADLVLPAHACYHFALALQLNGRWRDAAEQIERGLNQAADSTVHNLRLWHAFHQWEAGNDVDQRWLGLIDEAQLMASERYVFALLQCCATLGPHSFEEKLSDLDPYLRHCQSLYQATNGDELAVYPQRKIRAFLKASIESRGWFARLRFAFALSNRF